MIEPTPQFQDGFTHVGDLENLVRSVLAPSWLTRVPHHPVFANARGSPNPKGCPAPSNDNDSLSEAKQLRASRPRNRQIGNLETGS